MAIALKFLWLTSVAREFGLQNILFLLLLIYILNDDKSVLNFLDKKRFYDQDQATLFVTLS